MDLNKFTEKATAALGAAQEEAVRLGNQAVDVEHLFYALVTQEGGLIPRLFERLKVSLDLLLTKTQSALDHIPKVSGSGASGQVGITQRLNQLLVRAQDEAKKLKDDYVSVEHLVLTMFNEDKETEIARIFRSLTVTRAAFLTALQDVRGNQRVTRIPSKVWARPDRAGPPEQARPGDRARQ
jgi:ATP-dependent Clp protease ATP-binding subunit ClpB